MNTKHFFLAILLAIFGLSGCIESIKKEAREALASPEHKAELEKLGKKFQGVTLTQSLIDRTMAVTDELNKVKKADSSRQLPTPSEEIQNQLTEKIALKNGFASREEYETSLYKLMLLGMYSHELFRTFKEADKLNTDSLADKIVKENPQNKDWFDSKMQEWGKDVAKEVIGTVKEFSTYAVQDVEYLAQFSTPEERALAAQNFEKMNKKNSEKDKSVSDI
jgi:hypothetical protein